MNGARLKFWDWDERKLARAALWLWGVNVVGFFLLIVPLDWLRFSGLCR